MRESTQQFCAVVLIYGYDVLLMFSFTCVEVKVYHTQIEINCKLADNFCVIFEIVKIDEPTDENT